MAKTNLRVYNREIETLVDQNNVSEAIAHCKYVLKLFPKHVDTYRLLGKAYLENKRFSDAADLFQRVLSVFPDDFIAQIGMSIIREDDGNLDAAIWHMERAFEVQPSNTAIQDELRRLYGRRDGVAPQKVRLTRGALVRMYARGELFPQAIAEAKVALAEEPDRIDISVILAKMHSICNQKVEAAEICNQILIKLPYCYEANQILFEILPETSQEERKVYQQRLFAINPYSAYLSPSFPTVSLVPDQSVVLERLEYSGEMAAEEQPEWAQSVGADITADKKSSDWLPDNTNQFIHSPDITPIYQDEEVEPETVPVHTNPIPQDTTPVIPADDNNEDDLVPDWMKDEGWKKTDRSADEIMQSQEEAESETGMAIPAEMPSWLQDMAPADAPVVAAQTQPVSPNEDLSWLQEQSEANQSDNTITPSWMTEEQTTAATQPAATDSGQALNTNQNREQDTTPVSALQPPAPDSDLEAGMAWLEQLSQKHQQENETTPPSEITPAESDLPLSQPPTGGWNQAAPANEEIQPGLEPLPDWLRDIADMPAIEDAGGSQENQPSPAGLWVPENAADDTVAMTPNTMPEPDELPAWLQPDQVETNQPDPNLPAPAQNTGPEPEPELPVWQLPSNSDETPSGLDESSTQLPEWITSQSAIDNFSLDSLTQDLNQPSQPDEPVPSAPESREETPSANPPPAPQVNNAVPDEIPERIPPILEPLPVAPVKPETRHAFAIPPVVEPTPPPIETTGKDQDALNGARQAADSNKIQDALDQLNLLIQDGRSLKGVINQLLEMVYRHPVDPTIWQSLGDAYFKDNQLKEAIDSYTKAEELIR